MQVHSNNPAVQRTGTMMEMIETTRVFTKPKRAD